jgi:hypothetical protein
MFITKKLQYIFIVTANLFQYVWITNEAITRCFTVHVHIVSNEQNTIHSIYFYFIPYVSPSIAS